MKDGIWCFGVKPDWIAADNACPAKLELKFGVKSERNLY